RGHVLSSSLFCIGKLPRAEALRRGPLSRRGWRPAVIATSSQLRDRALAGKTQPEVSQVPSQRAPAMPRSALQLMAHTLHIRRAHVVCSYHEGEAFMSTWVLAAHRGGARIFAHEAGELHLLRSIEHPTGR